MNFFENFLSKIFKFVFQEIISSIVMTLLWWIMGSLTPPNLLPRMAMVMLKQQPPKIQMGATTPTTIQEVMNIRPIRLCKI